MAKIRYDASVMKYISTVESLTGARVKDCIPGTDTIKFIMHPHEVGKAIGKKGVNLRRLEGILKKKIQFVEFSEDIGTFIRSAIAPIRATTIEQEGSVVTVSAVDAKTRGLIIGRDRKNISALKDLVTRYFPITEIKVE